MGEEGQEQHVNGATGGPKDKDVLQVFDFQGREGSPHGSQEPRQAQGQVQGQVQGQGTPPGAAGASGGGAQSAPVVTSFKAPSVEELTALANEAYENYNFIEAAKLVKAALDVEGTFGPALELFAKLKGDHPQLFEGYVDPRGEDQQAVRGPPAQSTGGGPPGEKSIGISLPGKEEIIVEKRDIGEKGLVKTSTTKLDTKVYSAPKTLTETVHGDEKKGYADKKGGLSDKGTLAGLMMGVVALGIIIFALWWTGMLEF